MDETPLSEQSDSCRFSTRTWKLKKELAECDRRYITKVMIPDMEGIIAIEAGLDGLTALNQASKEAYRRQERFAAIVPITVFGTRYWAEWSSVRCIPEVRLGLGKPREAGRKHTSPISICAVIVDPKGIIDQPTRLVTLTE